MNDLIILELEDIQNKIYTIRGLQVMLDRDLAELYGVKSIRLREQVKRNLNRFPTDFMFRLNESEVETLVSQNAIPSKKHLGGSLPYAFTEQGVASLSAVLKSKRAAEIHVSIMRAFIKMRKLLSLNQNFFQRLEIIEKRQISSEIKNDEKFEILFKALEDKTLTQKQGVFFNGEIFDAYIFISDLIKSAKSSIILIDNYIDETVLILLAKRDKNASAIIYTKDITKGLKLDLKKHNKQYPSITIKQFKDSHDRFLIIDNSKVYHIGASLKDLGKKWFAFSKMDIDSFNILERLKE